MQEQQKFPRFLGCAMALILSSFVAVVSAQVTPSTPNPSESSPASSPNQTEAPPSGETYRIGEGDVLDVTATTGSGKSPQLSAENLQVNEQGSVQIFDGSIDAVCLTPRELAANIKTRYLQYKREPLNVVVNVKEYRSQLVAVIGAVKSPGRFELRRPIRLLELLALYANGPEDRSDGRIEVVHTRTTQCIKSGTVAETSLTSATYKWEDTRLGKDDANPYVRPGDVISLAEAPQIFVIGNVREPRNIPLKEKITLTTAIAMAGGTLESTKSDQIRIQRQMAGSASKELLVVNLNDIRNRKADDVVLKPGDIVDVPSSTTSKLLRGLLGTIIPITSQGTVRIIR